MMESPDSVAAGYSILSFFPSPRFPRDAEFEGSPVSASLTDVDGDDAEGEGPPLEVPKTGTAS